MNNRDIGKLGEKLAVDFLIDKDYLIEEINYYINKIGEIDIIAKNNDTYCFIEVKLRNSNKYGEPSEAVNYKKINKIKKVSMIYIKHKKLHNSNIRFDIIEIRKKYKSEYEITHIENAF
ncbi:MAG: YraN family protein [Clostridiales bacterium]